MKALKIIGIILLALLILGGVGYGAYALGTSQKNSDTNSNDNNNNSNNSNSNVQPKVVTEPTCNADELSLTVGTADAPGAGTLALSLVFENIGSRDCTLGGYPGVSLVNNNGNQVGSPADRLTGIDEKTITLKSGDTVSAVVNYPEEGNFDAGTCKDGATKLRVYPPNDYGYISVASPITGWCPGFKIGPVTAE